MKRLEESLEEASESSKKALLDADKERGSLDKVKSESKTLREELEGVRRDKAKLETDHKNLLSLSEKRKAAERDLEVMVKDLKEKLDK